MKEKETNTKDNLLIKQHSYNDIKIVSAIISPKNIFIMAGIVIVMIGIAYAWV